MTFRPATVALLLFFAAATAFFWVFAPRFGTATNIENLIAGFSFVAILAMGQAFPILVRGIDLSIGAIVALVGMVVFDLTLIFHVPGTLILPLALLTGIAAGALNGALIVYLRLQPFIATLATLAAYRGLVYSISGRQLVPGLSTTPITDKWITGIETYYDLGGAIGLSKLFPMPWFPMSFFIMLALLIAFQLLLTRTRFGRDIYAVGGNAEAARLSGINVPAYKMGAFVLSSVAAGFAGVLFGCRFGAINPTALQGEELTVIAAAILGGTSLFGGAGSVVKTLAGALLLFTLTNGFNILNLGANYQGLIEGTVLVVAAAIYTVGGKARIRKPLAATGTTPLIKGAT